ncbi:hypothetical protein CLU79DRAFT_191422 [Phycomyces nitens]|nr:hypothetical protein CLU79DRAFT_191422 [Phycomyces nitens]
MKERGQNGHSSGAASGLTKLDHGYERYIGWIERSLKAFGTVTLVGMESAIVDVVSMVTILQNRSIGEHEGNTQPIVPLFYTYILYLSPCLSEVETFPMRYGKRWTCGIQVRLHVI